MGESLTTQICTALHLPTPQRETGLSSASTAVLRHKSWCLTRETFVFLHLFAGVTENLPDKGSPCFNTIACMHSPLSPSKACRKKASVMKQKAFGYGNMFWFQASKRPFHKQGKEKRFLMGENALTVIFM